MHEGKSEVEVEGKGEEEDEEEREVLVPSPENQALQDKALQCDKKKAGQTSLPSIQNDSVRLLVDLGLKSLTVAIVFA